MFSVCKKIEWVDMIRPHKKHSYILMSKGNRGPNNIAGRCFAEMEKQQQGNIVNETTSVSERKPHTRFRFSLDLARAEDSQFISH